jgi:cyclopropane-fatty-acyl-phospholipid synthase
MTRLKEQHDVDEADGDQPGFCRPADFVGASTSHRASTPMDTLEAMLGKADVSIGGSRPWDIQVLDQRVAERVLAKGSLGAGESYMDGWWTCASLDQFFTRVLRARLDDQVGAGLMLQALRAKLFNLQSTRRAWQVGEMHYDIGNDLFKAMLDRRMTYTCGYWANSRNLEDAQEAKLDLICRKLGLRPGMRLLDIGCGWGSLMGFAAEHYGVSCVGLTISREQAEHGKTLLAGLPVEFRLADYRSYNIDGAERFDRIASVGMFEHVGHKNHDAFFAMARRCVADDGLFLLHTIGARSSNGGVDPWIDRYIFPNGELPDLGTLTSAAQDLFVVEDLHNFGADYDRTLMAWHERFEDAWPRFAPDYGERFYRMWRYYLLSCAAGFRSRATQLWQVVLSPNGLEGGYRRPA